ncbi:conserved hypothetical protein [Beggiatoa sp. PS]|nr:conserved hypothetical protein [Beggiatoa sp. PS]
MFQSERDQTRQFFFEVWRKHQNAQPLEPLETMVLEIILRHPEYQHYFSKPDTTIDFLPEQGQTNPFLHLGLHIALQEQLTTDRPPGIRTLYQSLASKNNDLHKVEHQMMDCLAETLWTSQRNGTMPDEQVYLACLHQIH